MFSLSSHGILGVVFTESLLYNKRESVLFVVPEESWFGHFLSRDMDFLWRLQWVIQTHQKQVSLFLHDRQTTTDLTKNFLQGSGKLVFGWWRERSSDGVVTDFPVMQVGGPAVAGGFLDEDLSGLWDVVVVEDFGLITCERCVVGQSA